MYLLGFVNDSWFNSSATKAHIHLIYPHSYTHNYNLHLKLSDRDHFPLFTLIDAITEFLLVKSILSPFSHSFMCGIFYTNFSHLLHSFTHSHLISQSLNWIRVLRTVHFSRITFRWLSPFFRVTGSHDLILCTRHKHIRTHQKKNLDVSMYEKCHPSRKSLFVSFGKWSMYFRCNNKSHRKANAVQCGTH